MFDIWFRGIELTTVILLPVQLLLCFKVKSLAIRLAPVIILSVSAAFSIVLWLSTPGWAGLGYVFLAIFAGFMVFMCGIGWAVWAVADRLKKKRGEEL